MAPTSFSVNDRTYTTPAAPVVVICIDGSEPDYHLEAMRAGHMPWLSGLLAGETVSDWPAHCALPALTNTNNLSIATGRPASVHGISGNYLFDTGLGEEVMMNDKRFLRVPTVFGAATEAGLDVAVVTAKDKLRRLLGAGVVEDGPDGAGAFVAPSRRGICFSAEKADEATVEANGVGDVPALVGLPVPSVYSADLSEFVLAAGVALLRRRPMDLMYLSLTDYIQHKHAPGTDVANAFYAMIDRYAAALDGLGAVVVLTADHGMSAKTDAAGVARVLYLEDVLREHLEADDGLRVILPITDPYTVHHGALGSFAGVHLPPGADVDAAVAFLSGLDGVEVALPRDVATGRLGLPADRIGDVVVLAEAGVALGRYPAWHDLSGLDAPLRSHGGLGELQVPFVVNRRLPRPSDLDTPYGGPACVHNYDAFWVATTLVAQQETAVGASS